MSDRNEPLHETPTPGSGAALDLGCTCPVLDNGHGRGSGWLNNDGAPAFWVDQGCPLHGEHPIRSQDKPPPPPPDPGTQPDFPPWELPDPTSQGETP